MPTRTRHRIVFVNRSYWPDIEATGQLLTDLCEGLSLYFDVHVICGQPNSPEPNSSFLQVGVEQRNGITIHRLEHRRSQKKDPLGRVLGLVSFYRAAHRYLKHHDPHADVIVSETDPFLLPIAGAQYARRTGAKHCVYLQDIYPDVAEVLGKIRIPWLASGIRRRLRAAYRDADALIVLGRCMQRRLTNPPWELSENKIAIVPNWSDCDAIEPVAHDVNGFRNRHCQPETFLVMHSGNMGLTQRLDVLMSAAAESAWPEHAKLLLVGNGASRDRLLQHMASLQMPEGRVDFVNYQPRHRLAESLSAADVHVVSMHQDVTGCLCPSKLYGIMASGRPVIGVADSETDLCETVREHALGWTVPPGSPAAIASAVAKAAQERCNDPGAFDQRGNRARQVAREHFDRPVIVSRFAALLDRLLIASAAYPSDRDDQRSNGDTSETTESGIALTR